MSRPESIGASADQQDQSPSAGPSTAPNININALFPPVYFSDPTSDSKNPSFRPPYTDSTCLSWCSQASHRRSEGYDPVCRMFCWKVDREDGQKLSNPTGLGKKPHSNGPEVTEISVSAIRRGIRRWIDERELSFFKGSLDELRAVQNEERELQRMEREWENNERKKEGVPSIEEEARQYATNHSPTQQTSIAGQSKALQGHVYYPEAASIDQDRATVERRRRRKRDELDWAVQVREVGETGRLVEIPLSSIIIKPYYHFLHRLDVIFGPSRKFVRAYMSSFTDGSQSRIAGLAYEKAKSGEVLHFGYKLGQKVVGAWTRPWPGSRGGNDNEGEGGEGGRRGPPPQSDSGSEEGSGETQHR